jgi:iron uptake system component EfeO
MKLSPLLCRAAIATVLLPVFVGAVSLTSCTATTPVPDNESTADPVSAITVGASDTACALSASTMSTGSSTFIITNNGTKITEFYVYGEGDRVIGEVENISPGLQRKLVVQLAQPGTYQAVCKPGMIGDGIRADFTVT